MDDLFDDKNLIVQSGLVQFGYLKEETESKDIKAQLQESYGPASLCKQEIENDAIEALVTKTEREQNISRINDTASGECKVSLERVRLSEEQLRTFLPSVKRALPETYQLAKGIKPYHVASHSVTHSVANICTFSCLVCAKKVPSLSELIQHNKNQHAIKIRWRRNILKSKGVLEARWHACKVCHFRILCDKVSIRHHAKRHGLTLKQYRAMLPQPFGGKKNLDLRRSHPPTDYFPPKTKARPHERTTLRGVERFNVPPASITREIEDLCSYQCDGCGGVFKMSWQRFSQHVFSCEETPRGFISRDVIAHRLVEELRYFECFRCGGLMFSDTLVIKRHSYHCTRSGQIPRPEGFWKRYQTLLKESSRQGIHRTNKSSQRPLVLPRPVNNISSVKREANVLAWSEEIKDKCLFGCDKCRFKSDSWTMMANHNRKSDHGPGNIVFDTKYILEAVYHQCKICLKVLLCDYNLISHHMIYVHKMTVSEYQEKLGLNQNTDEEPNSDNDWNTLTKEEANNLCKQTPCLSHNVIPNPSTPTSRFVDDSVMVDVVGNLCKFICAKCTFCCSSWDVLKKHKTREHLHKSQTGGAEREILLAFKRNQLLEARFHKCRICGIGIVCDASFIKRHVNRQHKFNTLERYYNVPSKLVRKEKRGTDDSVSKKYLKKVVKGIERLGHFSCKFCAFSHHEFLYMRAHVLESRHGLGLHSTRRAKPIASCILHTCQLCLEPISCNQTNIFSHLRPHHKITVKDYSRKVSPFETNGTQKAKMLK